MTRLPELHRLLVQGARRQEAEVDRTKMLEAQVSRSRLLALALRVGIKGRHDGTTDLSPHRRGLALLPRGLRAPLLALGALLLSATIALAATGVIEIGSPVRPKKPPRPTAGVGAPVRSRVRLLPLRVPDPAGGLPWGVRVVPTTRGEVCLQIGRVEHGQLGELGIDGAFHDDGRFHPISVDDLPERSHGGGGESYDVLCQLSGLYGSWTMWYPRSAGSVPPRSLRSFPRRNVRRVSFGLLGGTAVSVAYREGEKVRTEHVAKNSGVYLVVQRPAPGEQVEPLGTGGGVSGAGEFVAKRPLTAITYRIDGMLCDRALGHMREHGCPRPRPTTPGSPMPRFLRGGRDLSKRLEEHLLRSDLHKPLHTHLLISKGLLTGVEVSFRAPFAIKSARAEYSLGAAACRETRTGPDGPWNAGSSILEHDVRRGQLVSLTLYYPFEKPCPGRSITIEAAYREGLDFGPLGEPGTTLIGTATVRQPPHTSGEPPWRHEH